MCLQPRGFVSISLHLHLCKLPFIERISLPFWAPFLCWLSRFYKLSFIAGKLWEMLSLIKVTKHAKRPHNLILIFFPSIDSKTIKMFHRSPPTNNRRHCEKFAFTNYTFLQARFRNVTRSGKYEQAIQIPLRDFSLILWLQEDQKTCLWSVAKRKTKLLKYRAFLNSFFVINYGHRSHLQSKWPRACLHGVGGPQIGEVDRWPTKAGYLTNLGSPISM